MDLVSASEQRRLLGLLRTLNPGADILPTRESKVPLARVNFPASDWSDAAKASGLTDYPETTLVKLATTKLAESGDPFASLVANFEWTNDDQNGVALDIESGMSPEEAARKWIDANPDKVAAWTAQM